MIILPDTLKGIEEKIGHDAFQELQRILRQRAADAVFEDTQRVIDNDEIVYPPKDLDVT